MRKYNDCYYLRIVDDKPAGFIGSVDGDIRVATHPDFQGKGIGLFMVNELMKIYPGRFAKIKMGNEASVKLFRKAGFKKKYYIYEKDNS